MGGGGDSPYNAQYVEATKWQAWSNLQIAQEDAAAKRYGDLQQSQAVIKSARLDKEARIYESDQNKMTQMEALRVRDKESFRQYQTDLRMANAEMIRAEAMASKVNVESREIDLEDRRENREMDQDEREWERRTSSSSNGSYWYG